MVQIQTPALVVLLTVARYCHSLDMAANLTDSFLYFGYGSNLYSRRIHVNNPSAIRHGIGKLQGYRLDFGTWSKTWGGAPASIVPDPDAHVWGALWVINNADLPNLDRQEGVDIGWYRPVTLTVQTPEGSDLGCRSYLFTDSNQPSKLLPGETPPPERQPSKSYKQVILRGARESGLPAEYISQLESIPSNDHTGGPINFSEDVNP